MIPVGIPACIRTSSIRGTLFDMTCCHAEVNMTTTEFSQYLPIFYVFLPQGKLHLVLLLLLLLLLRSHTGEL